MLLTTPLDVALLILPCCMLLAVADLAIAAIPFRRLTGCLGRPIGSSAFVPIASERQMERARRSARAIAIAARLVPFRANCYPQALVAVVLGVLFRVPTAIHFGARMRIEETLSLRRMEGHVWVVSGQVSIPAGVDSDARFPTVACFVRQNGCLSH